MIRVQSNLTPQMRAKAGDVSLPDLLLQAETQAVVPMKSRLAKALNDKMASPASVQYRLAYQRHRLGGASGSVGEAPDDKMSHDSLGSALLLEALEAEGGVGGGVFGATEMYASEKGFHELLKWRLAYQSHRSGASRGAKGEMGAGLSVADVRMLPVAELAAHTRQTSAGRLAALPETDDEEEAAEHLRPTHIHVGAGRLGLGLLLPALARTSQSCGGRLVILQRPSDAWAALADGSEVRFTVNQQLVCTLRVVRTASRDALASWAESPPDAGLDGLLVLSEEEGLLDYLATTATSLSCSLGPALSSGARDPSVPAPLPPLTQPYALCGLALIGPRARRRPRAAALRARARRRHGRGGQAAPVRGRERPRGGGEARQDVAADGRPRGAARPPAR